MNIVIVDDQTSARTMLRHILEDISPELEVFDFGDPETALRWCDDNRIVAWMNFAAGNSQRAKTYRTKIPGSGWVSRISHYAVNDMALN